MQNRKKIREGQHYARARTVLAGQGEDEVMKENAEENQGPCRTDSRETPIIAKYMISYPKVSDPG